MSHVIGLLGCVALICASVDAAVQRKPRALVEAERARSAEALRTGYVEWRVESRLADRPRIALFNSRLAGDELTTSEEITEKRVVPGADGKTRIDYRSIGRLRALRDGNEFWWHADRTTSAYVLPSDAPLADEMADIRSVGLNPWSWNEVLCERMLREGHDPDVFDSERIARLHGSAARIGELYERTLVEQPEAVAYQSAIDKGLHVVTARFGDAMLRWWIDAEQGWNPVRTEAWDGGQLICKTRVANAQRGETWFPHSVRFYSPAFRDGGEPFQAIAVQAAAFNSPDDPPELTAEHIGVEVGMRVLVSDGRPPMYWDGKGAVPWEEFSARLESGELGYGPSVREELTRGREGRTTQPVWAAEPTPPGVESGVSPPDDRRPPSPARLVVDFESEWERYTRLFIQKYRLNEEQTQKAMSILRSCQAMAQRHVLRHKTQLDELERRMVELKREGQSRASSSVAALEKQKAKLLEPIGEIFEKQLKPRLDKLPTRAQRRAAEDKATKPSKKKQDTKSEKP